MTCSLTLGGSIRRFGRAGLRAHVHQAFDLQLRIRRARANAELASVIEEQLRIDQVSTREELEKVVAEIEQVISLLRRHL